jgi:putative toxin-antitoxin system antitoxin component (TIGR02293 family)
MSRTATATVPSTVLQRVQTAEKGITRKEATRLFEVIAHGTQRPLREVRSGIIPDSSWKRSGDRLTPSATQSTLRLERVLQLAQSIWGEKQAAAAWLNAPHPELAGATPYSLLRTEAGGRAVEDLLIALEHGFAV